jgi:hypothetical protein
MFMQFFEEYFAGLNLMTFMIAEQSAIIANVFAIYETNQIAILIMQFTNHIFLKLYLSLFG